MIGLSVACRRKVEEVRKIGANIGGRLKSDEEKEEEYFSYNNFFIDGFAVYWHLNYVFYLPCHKKGKSYRLFSLN